MDRVIWSERPDHFWRQITKTVSSRPFFSNSQSIISWTDLRISVPMTFMRSPALRRFFYIKKNKLFGTFFSNSRSIISGTDLRISVPMTFMRSPVLRRFFYIKKKNLFWTIFFQICGPLSQERTWGFRIEVPRPQTFGRESPTSYSTSIVTMCLRFAVLKI